MLMVVIIVSKNLVKSVSALNAAITTIVFQVRAMWTRMVDFLIQVHGTLLGGKRTFAFKLVFMCKNKFSRRFNTILSLLIHRYMQKPIFDIGSVATM